MSAHANKWITTTAVVSLVAGMVLAHLVEPCVRVEKIILAGDTPAIHIVSTSPRPHPVALLAHGVTASKETLFRIGEALGAAGFDCYAVDEAGHGESRLPFLRTDIVNQLGRVTQAIGRVDVFIGHSMGAGVGAACVQNGDLRPKLFVALGADPYFGERGPPLLLLGGYFEELVRPTRLKERSDARVVISPWSDHALEVLDPRLVKTAVDAACAAVGKEPPPAPRFWMVRFAGLVLATMGALILIWRLPEMGPLNRFRGIFIPGIIIVVVCLAADKWVGSALNLHRIPLQVAIGVVVWLALAGIGKLGIPRWSLAVVVGMVTIACIFAGLGFLCIMGAVVTLFFCAGTVLGGIAARGAPRWNGDVALAIFVGFAIGQWIPNFF